MANSVLTIDMVTRRAVMLFKNSNAFIQGLDRQYDDQFGIQGAQIGSTLRVKYPADYVVSDGPALSLQDTNIQNTTLTLATQRHVDIAFNSAERTLKIQDYEENYLVPAMNNLAGNVAATIMSGVEGGVCNFVANKDGSNNIIAPTKTQILKAGAILTDNSAQRTGRRFIASPTSMANAVDTLSGLFNPVPAISKQYYEGQVYDALNFRWFEDPTVLAHTTGTFTAGTVNGASQTGTTLVTNAITGTLRKGDIITIALVNAVNRVTKTTTGGLRQFVVTANVANGATSIPIYPAIIPGGVGYDANTGLGAQQYQTVDVSPANAAAISLANKASEVYRKNIAYAPKAITMVTADLVIPPMVESSRKRYDNISMRMVHGYLMGTDQIASRVDVLFGFLFVRPEWATIVADSVA